MLNKINLPNPQSLFLSCSSAQHLSFFYSLHFFQGFPSFAHVFPTFFPIVFLFLSNISRVSLFLSNMFHFFPMFSNFRVFFSETIPSCARSHSPSVRPWPWRPRRQRRRRSRPQPRTAGKPRFALGKMMIQWISGRF